jgi:hypothetical protein
MLKDPAWPPRPRWRRARRSLLGELARNLYSLHSASGAGKLDFSSILLLLQGALLRISDQRGLRRADESPIASSQQLRAT